MTFLVKEILMAAIIFFLMGVGVFSAEVSQVYEGCKKEDFKPAVCEKYKSLIPPKK
jgi:hypothetical protein